ncbi:hypothetical protein HMPREF3201_01356 [Megasphaera sp. MJR8396C]|nr:hypothetical protein HMPREF3201_01356 [Megasphaera sp. MJR8396C]
MSILKQDRLKATDYGDCEGFYDSINLTIFIKIIPQEKRISL